MSYNIIKSIKIDDENKRVIIGSASNNVTPRYYTTEEAPYFTRLWAEKGREAVDIALVKAFESGDFQGGSSKWKLAADRLRKMPEYQAFNWRSEPFEEISQRRREQVAEFDALVLRALQAKEPKERFVITGNPTGSSQTLYFYHRANAGFCRWFTDIKKAKVFNCREDAENMKRLFNNSSNWQVLQIA